MIGAVLIATGREWFLSLYFALDRWAGRIDAISK